MKRKSIRFPQTHHLRPMLGINKGKLPKNDIHLFLEKDGLKFHLLPASPTNTYSRPHRLLVTCNVCGKEVSAGRFNQHQAIHPTEQLSKLSLDWLEKRW